MRRRLVPELLDSLPPDHPDALRPIAPWFDSIDRVPRPLSWPADARWHQADINAFNCWRDYSVVIGNLILHHFDDTALRTLGNAISPHARLLIFSEPTRKRLNQWVWNIAAPLGGANHVTRQDSRVSITAGFLNDELPRMFGLATSVWR